MISLELVNAWGSAWLGLMARAVIEGSVLLAVIAAVWLPFRRRISAQFAHGLFCLVLLKLIIPVPLALSWWPSDTEIAVAATESREPARAGVGAARRR